MCVCACELLVQDLVVPEVPLSSYFCYATICSVTGDCQNVFPVVKRVVNAVGLCEVAVKYCLISGARDWCLSHFNGIT